MNGRSALFGREAERALLSDALVRARDGHGSLLLLCGEAGVGKTRLAEELAAGSDVLVLRGAGSSSAVTPHGPLVAVLRGCCSRTTYGERACSAVAHRSSRSHRASSID